FCCAPPRAPEARRGACPAKQAGAKAHRYRLQGARRRTPPRQEGRVAEKIACPEAPAEVTPQQHRCISSMRAVRYGTACRGMKGNSPLPLITDMAAGNSPDRLWLRI